MQLALPCLLFAPAVSKLILRGGTNAEMAPPVDFMTDVSCRSLFEVLILILDTSICFSPCSATSMQLG